MDDTKFDTFFFFKFYSLPTYSYFLSLAVAHFPTTLVIFSTSSSLQSTVIDLFSNDISHVIVKLFLFLSYLVLRQIYQIFPKKMKKSKKKKKYARVILNVES